MTAVLHVQPRRAVRGTLRVPGDKSISHRYVMLGAIADGDTTMTGLASGADVAATLAAVRALGVAASGSAADSLIIHGRGRRALCSGPEVIDAANSGTTLRLLAGLLAGCPFRSTMTGDASLRRRPMQRIIDPLTAMGARITSDRGHAPLAIDGGALRAIDWTSQVASAQVKSAIMLAGLSANGTTRIMEPLATRDHTERAFPAFGLTVAVHDRTVSVAGGQEATAPADLLRVPGDPSSAAVWAAAAAALAGSSVRLEGVCLNPSRLGFVAALERLGARVTLDQTALTGGEPVGTITIRHEAHGATRIEAPEVPGLIDELPVLAARAALGGRLEVSGAGELRVKESDRITALVTGLRALGVAAEETADGFTIDGTRPPAGGHAEAAGDHRLVMAFALVALGATGPSTIGGAEAVAVSYPGFARDLERLAT